jgi:hypothetical protein
MTLFLEALNGTNIKITNEISSKSWSKHSNCCDAWQNVVENCFEIFKIAHSPLSLIAERPVTKVVSVKN